jgi:hypothetical protein
METTFRLSNVGKPSFYPSHVKQPCFPNRKIRDVSAKTFVVPEDKQPYRKFFPKSAKYIGVISRCPKCGLKGALSFHFKYDSCIDTVTRTVLESKLRDLTRGNFIVQHRGKNHKYLYCCNVSIFSRDLLNGLLLHGKVIPEVIERSFEVDRFGKGFNVNGKLVWSEKVK